jgi:hypothetical protein
MSTSSVRRDCIALPTLAREREAFDRARLAADLQVKARTAALVWAAAGLFALLVAILTWNKLMGFFNPGVLLGVCFLAGAAVTFVLSFFVKPESPWRAVVGLDDETLKSLGGRRR